ncbi:chymotrypsin/elastase isoinhibitors 2 to 5-like [Cotesia typhae]|uniref:chymotrypsin/elastase isoinhibitors 2 to 5-like n=1 Tax=Cotesia typhae TaxID=2053667 RepID=UPI003D69F06B
MQNNSTYAMSRFLLVKIFFIFSLIGVYVEAGQSCRKNCGKNAFCNPCGNHCEKFCSDEHQKPCTRICNPPGCQCKENFMRDKSTNKCVLKENCSSG